MNSNSNRLQKVVKSLWVLFGVGFLLIFGLILSIRFNLFNLFGEIPSFDDLENPQSSKASVIYSADGQILGKYFSTENRVRVTYNDISPYVVQALIATEDERFNSHSGIDGRSLLRVLRGIVTFHLDGGGSTITQQLAKNLFQLRNSEKYSGTLSDSKFKLLGAKLKEWITAVWLEKSYTKTEIITMYLNTVNHGVKANGIHSGAKIYFDKHCKDLKIEEAATLVGTFKSNYTYDPISNPEKSKIRRNQVFTQMFRSKFIESEEELEKLKELPFKLNYSPDSYNQGIATYFREAIRDEIESLIDDDYDLTKDGLKIYTTIDYNMQRIAEKNLLLVMKEKQQKFIKEWGNTDPWENKFLIDKVKQTPEYQSLSKEYSSEKELWNQLRKPRLATLFTYNGEKDTMISVVDEVRHYYRMLRAAMVVLDYTNGHVKAWVGGIDKKYFDYDMVQKGSRQVGSTFKPILYTLAIQNGYEPCSQFANTPVTIQYADGRTWQPRVPDWVNGEPIYLKDALKKSLNNIAAKLVEEYGIDRVIDMAEKFDIETENMQKNVSMVLGTSDMKMLDIIKPYQIIGNLGLYHKHVKITKIEDYQGKVLYEYVPEQERVIDEMVAYKMATMLRGVTEEGTASMLATKYKLVGDGNMLAGKTGTTQDSKDCWFIGFNNQLAVATWVGPESYGIKYRNSGSWYGGNTALPIFAGFLQDCYATPSTGVKKGPFKTPKELTEEMIREKLLCQGDSTEESFEFD